MRMVNSLFDKKRRERLRDAVRKGDLAAELRRHLPVTEMDLAPTQVFSREAGKPQMPAGPSAIRAPDQMMQSQILGFGGTHLSAQDEALFDAIKMGDAGKVLNAIMRGADVNKQAPYIPSHRMKDTMISLMLTPLAYARKLGNPDVIRVLVTHGARD